MIKDCCLAAFIYPCLTYAMLRTGAGDHMTISEFETLQRHPVPDDNKDIPEGAILYWANSEGYHGWQLTIKDKIVLETGTYNRGHYAVYEGNGTISDLAWNGDVPYIRMRKLCDLSRPDKMILL